MTAKPVMSMVACKAALDAITAKLTSTSSIKIYTGSQPATTLTAASGTLLSSGCTFSATAFPSSTSGTSDGNATATANAIASDTNAAGTGVAGYFRFVDGGGSTVVIQGNVGTSAADMILSSTSITAADTIVISSAKLTMQCGDGTS